MLIFEEVQNVSKGAFCPTTEMGFFYCPFLRLASQTKEGSLMGIHNDPTASAAIGAVDREIRAARRAAYRLKHETEGGPTASREDALRRRYAGLPRFLLEEALVHDRY
jgi:hypothetical protein